MPPRNPAGSRPPSFNRPAPIQPSIGRLYRDIQVTPDAIFAKEDLATQREHPFVRYCKDMYRRFPGLGKGATYNDQYRESIAFLGWRLKPEEFASAVKGTMLLIILVGALLSIGIGLLFGESLGNILGVSGLISIVYLLIPVILIAVFAANFVQGYPLAETRREQLRALTYVPEIVGYLIMSMKLVPNLEKAVAFAADHSSGRIAQEFKRIIWNTQLGMYNTIAEGLDELAYNWGKYSSEFKQALMNVRASVLENTESKRYQLLDKTMDDVLESVQGKMEQFARDLSQPSTLLFYVGVLLPLILIIILPVGSAFSGSPLAQSWVLFLIYDIALPLMVIIFSNALLETRPPTYTPPTIPDGFPGIPPKNMVRVGKSYMSVWVVVVGMLIVGGMISGYAHFFGVGVGDPKSSDSFYLLKPDNTLASVLAEDAKQENYYEPGGARESELQRLGFDPEEIEIRLRNEKAGFLAQAKNDITPYNAIFGILITLGIAIGAFVELTSKEKKKMQEKFMQMESEFKDSLYVMASRLGENKPIEDALKHTQSFLPNSTVAQEVFGKTVDNIHVLGMPLEAAVFDPAYGSLRSNPSKVIASSMKIAIDSVKLGVGVAARTLISLSRQLSNSERVSKMLTTLIKDITGTMKTVSIYIAPIVLGITTSLQRVVIVTLTGISASAADSPTPTNLGSNVAGSGASFASTDVSSFIKPEIISTLATPGEFIIIVAVYVIELVLIMNYFITMIEENNSLQARMNAGKSLPIAIIIFVVTVIISNSLVSTNFGA